MPKAARRLRALRHQLGSTQRAKAAVSAGDPPEYALVVRGGTVLDGSGSPRFVGDVAVGSNGRIAAVGAEIAGRGAQEKAVDHCTKEPSHTCGLQVGGA